MKSGPRRRARSVSETGGQASVPSVPAGRRDAKKKSGRREGDWPAWLPPLRLPFVPILFLAGSSFLPRIFANDWLASSFWAATAFLLLLQLLLRRDVARAGRVLTYELVPQPVHYLQAIMQVCIYVYWGSYWPEVWSHVPLIAAQLAFVYALDMLVTWLRQDRWILGFGPFPIVFATNLFMWFRDDWFFLQFALVGTGVLGKQFFRWTRDGRVTHIFNPSTLALFLFSIVLIATDRTNITWGREIAATLGLPPNIYLEVFLVGLVVQASFSVTLVTLSAAATIYALNLLFTATTGTYNFIITNIPIAVFLGLHLLVTDPATSPRTALGRLVFGALYGACSFGLFGVLDVFGIPTFYDKLLCVPALNLTVRWLDRVSRELQARYRSIELVSSWKRLNPAAMAVWASLFAVMTTTGFIGREHPGRDPEFWRRACHEGRWNGCRRWVTLLDFTCRGEVAESCTTLGELALEGRFVPRDPLNAGKHFTRACNLGFRDGCSRLGRFMDARGADTFRDACEAGDGESCFVLGELHHYGAGVPQDDAAAIDLFHLSCARGWPRGCGRLGESYLAGQGVPVDPVKAIESFEKACDAKLAAGCFAAAAVYRRGVPGFDNEALARERSSRACDLGLKPACLPGESPLSSSAAAFEAELLQLGG